MGIRSSPVKLATSTFTSDKYITSTSK